METNRTQYIPANIWISQRERSAVRYGEAQYLLCVAWFFCVLFSCSLFDFCRSCGCCCWRWMMTKPADDDLLQPTCTSTIFLHLAMVKWWVATNSNSYDIVSCRRRRSLGMSLQVCVSHITLRDTNTHSNALLLVVRRSAVHSLHDYYWIVVWRFSFHFFALSLLTFGFSIFSSDSK